MKIEDENNRQIIYRKFCLDIKSNAVMKPIIRDKSLVVRLMRWLYLHLLSEEIS